MARKSSTDSRISRVRSRKSGHAPIPEPFQVVSASVSAARVKKVKVPKLVLSGEWLKAIGFPIGAPLHLASDRRGELVLQRLGLRLPRTLRIVAKCQRPGALRLTLDNVGVRGAGKHRGNA